ncbi:AGE family epimerase/isomerase [Bacteroides uniformis]|nr:AGE family epimerase/isomerase [Bacteroides uniformis]
MGDPEVIGKCRKVALELADASLKEGINPMGAMMYERHKDKIRKDASWWCQAETVVGCINAWQLTGEQSYPGQCRPYLEFHQVPDDRQGVWRMVQNRAGRWDSPLQGT